MKNKTTLDATGNIKILRQYFKCLYANNFETQSKWTNSQENIISQNFKEGIENLNSPIGIKVIK